MQLALILIPYTDPFSQAIPNIKIPKPHSLPIMADQRPILAPDSRALDHLTGLSLRRRRRVHRRATIIEEAFDAIQFARMLVNCNSQQAPGMHDVQAEELRDHAHGRAIWRQLA
ncbi:hypothetical protein PENVUL_c007G00541 [Penicillium vulpinum]|uniref:Uncharacterized protein n=1 Tax=Penicillium vulpinum TaxID=29845 RepID=A0A1V6S676_9EURO|nr:hypothetical protein PENVUL_c007G00541 [Penicillium vulpinum]